MLKACHALEIFCFYLLMFLTTLNSTISINLSLHDKDKLSALTYAFIVFISLLCSFCQCQN